MKQDVGMTQEQIAVLKDRCEKDLNLLCTEFLGYQDWDVVHDDVEFFLKKPGAKKALLMPRGHLKSSIVTIAWTIQQILRNPNVRILIANQIWDMSRNFLSEIKGQLENSNLKYLYGNFVSQKWNADDVIVKQRWKSKKESTITTTGVEAEQTGGHYEIIILDDLTGLQNSATPEQREKTKRFRRSMINLLEPGGKLIEIGTRWHLDDTFSVIFEKEMKYYDVMVKKVVENGKIIFPKKFSKKWNPVTLDWDASEVQCMDYIDHLKATLPIDEFMAQYHNEPISSENQVFKEEMFKSWRQRPEGMYVAMAVDLAISQKTEADYTALVVAGMDPQWNVYVLDYLRGKWSPSEIVDNIFDMQSRWKPNMVGMETNGFQRTLKFAVEDEMRRRKQYFGVDEIKNGPERSKENRIKSLEPFYRQGKVFHALWMKGKDFETELLTFPKGRHDDIIDALAMCLPMLSPGSVQSSFSVPPGSWEDAFLNVQRRNRPPTQFFGMGYK